MAALSLAGCSDDENGNGGNEATAVAARAEIRPVAI